MNLAWDKDFFPAKPTRVNWVEVHWEVEIQLENESRVLECQVVGHEFTKLGRLLAGTQTNEE